MGTVYLQDLDSANQTDIYTLRGYGHGDKDQGGVEEFVPWATTHGFRYVELRYLTEGVAPPSLDSLEALAIRSGMEQSGRVSVRMPSASARSAGGVRPRGRTERR